MTSKGESYFALSLFSVGLFVIPSIVGYGKLPEWIAVTSCLSTVLFLLFWGLTFSCPKCGAPFLWEIRGHRKIVRLIPKGQCTKCGFPTDQVIR